MSAGKGKRRTVARAGGEASPVGRPPYGFSAAGGGRLVPDPDTAPILLLMFRLFRRHRRKHTVATCLNEAGYRTREEKLFTPRTVGRILDDPGTGPAAGVLEGIVPAELREECRAILESAEGGDASRRKPVQLLGGYTWCECGGRMYVRSNSPKYVCGECKNKIPVADLEAIFRERLTRYTLTPEEIAGYARVDETEVALMKDLEGVLRRSELRVREGIAALSERRATGEIGESELRREQSPLRERLDQIDSERSRIEKAIALAREGGTPTAASFGGRPLNLYECWPRMSAEGKRKAVEAVLRRITVGERRILFVLHDLDEDREEPPTSCHPAGAAPSENSAYADFSSNVTRSRHNPGAVTKSAHKSISKDGRRWLWPGDHLVMADFIGAGGNARDLALENPFYAPLRGSETTLRKKRRALEEIATRIVREAVARVTLRFQGDNGGDLARACLQLDRSLFHVDHDRQDYLSAEELLAWEFLEACGTNLRRVFLEAEIGSLGLKTHDMHPHAGERRKPPRR